MSDSSVVVTPTPVPNVTPAAPATAPLEAERVKQLEAKLEEFGRRFEGVSAALRKSEDFIAKLTPTPAPATKPDRVEALENELKAMRDKQVQTERRAAIIGATSGLGFYDAEDVVERVGKQIQQREDGSYFVEIAEVLPETGRISKREASIPEAVKALAKEKPYLVKTTVNDGTGAGGSKAGAPTTDPTYEQLMRDPKLMASLPMETVTRIQNDAFAAKKGK